MADHTHNLTTLKSRDQLLGACSVRVADGEKWENKRLVVDMMLRQPTLTSPAARMKSRSLLVSAKSRSTHGHPRVMQTPATASFRRHRLENIDAIVQMFDRWPVRMHGSGKACSSVGSWIGNGPHMLM